MLHAALTIVSSAGSPVRAAPGLEHSVAIDESPQNFVAGSRCVHADHYKSSSISASHNHHRARVGAAVGIDRT